MEIQGLFNEEITRRLEELRDMQVGSDEYKAAVDNLTKLTDRAIEMEKVHQDANEKVADRLMRNGQEFDRRQDEKKDRIVQYCLRGVEVAIPIALTVWGTITTLKYDKEGVLPTTLMGRGFINKLIPKK